MTPRTKNIGISFGEIKHFHDGIGEFSRQFGLTLAERAPALKQQGIHLYYHLPKAHHGLFGTEVGYLHARSRQRHIQIRPIRFDIWHSLNQHIRLKAPVGTRTQILTLHDLNLFYFMSGTEKERALKRQLKNLKRADTIVTISDYVKQDLHSRLGWPGPVHRIYNGVRSLLQQAADSAARKAMDHGLRTVQIFVRGPGAGRESALRALQSAGINISLIKDVTPIPHNGCRPPKKRRI